MSSKLKVLIVEPSSIIVEGMLKILNRGELFHILPPLPDVQHLQEKLSVSSPDILILNPTLMFPTKRFSIFSFFNENPHIAVVALVYQYVEAKILSAYHGVIDIRENPGQIATILLESQAALREVVPLSDSYELSDRETEVLICLAKGLISKEIAGKLNISVHTVNSHRKNITRKTGIKSVAGLAVYAMLHNLTDK